MRISAFNFRRSLRMMVFLCCFCTARILSAADPAPGAASTASHSKGEPLILNEDQLELAAGSSSTTLKSKVPQRPETLESLFKGSQPGPAPRLPQPQASPNPRTKTPLDEQETWIFLTPDEILQDLMIKEKLAPPEYTADGREKSTLSPIERYYHRLSSTRQGTNAPSTFRKPPFNGSTEDSDLISEFGNIPYSAQDRSLPGLDRISGRPNSFSDLLGVNRGRGFKGEITRQTLEEERAQARHLENFRKLMDIPTLPDPTAGFGMPENPDTAGSARDGYSAAARPNPYTTPSSPTPSPASGTLGMPPIVPAQLRAGQQGLAPEPPQPLTRTPPPKLQFSSPMRKF